MMLRRLNKRAGGAAAAGLFLRETENTHEYHT